MDYKEQLRILKEIATIGAKTLGVTLDAEAFADRMKIKNTDYWYQLIGESGKVTEKHILKFKNAFGKELKAVGVVLPGETATESQSLVLAMFDDYCERMAAIEHVEKSVVRVRILNKATQFSDVSVGADPQQ